ncbi:MAG: 3-phosphoshikimate 1-carboxyvinyltransferase [Candidatus Sericytochromatia bacterium]
MTLEPETQHVTRAEGLRGSLRVPSDKSLSHRSIMFGSLASGTSRIREVLRSEDCMNTLACFAAMGVRAGWAPNGDLQIEGLGLDGLQEPGDVLQAGNSGTTMRLMSGVLAGAPFFSTITGDASLRNRPMGRVVGPLTQMGARIWGRQGARLAPLAIQGGQLQGIDYASPVASAQIKSALLLAGLFAEGPTRVTEPARSRDHTERMLAKMGAEIQVDGLAVTIRPRPRLAPLDLTVPGDISSAAFWLVAASLVQDSDVLLRDVGVNPTRTGILDVLAAMGADITRENERDEGGEPVCDLRVRSARLHGTVIAGDLIPRLIDEIPILAVAAASAEGPTEIRDAEELRVKESDRLTAIVQQFGPLGLDAEERPDGLLIRGGARWRGGRGTSGGDHRIAMSLAVIGLLADGPVEVGDTACTRTSYPRFWDDLAMLRQAP